MKFAIVHKQTLEELVEAINTAMVDGFEPVGAIFRDGHTGQYVQGGLSPDKVESTPDAQPEVTTRVREMGKMGRKGGVK